MEVDRELTTGSPPQKNVFPEYNLLTYLSAEKNKEYTNREGITWQTLLITRCHHNATHVDVLSHIQLDEMMIQNKFL